MAAQDAQSATVTSSTTAVTISLTAATANGATLLGTTTVSAASGVASFSGLAIQKAGTYTLTATAQGLESAISSQISVTPGAPAKLAMAKQASSGPAGSTLPSVEIGVEDAFSNRIPSAPVTVAIDVTAGSGPSSGPGPLFGTKTSSVNASGVATFSDLSIQKAGLNYTLTATAAGLTSTVSAAFGIAPSTPSKLLVMTQPTNVVAGATMSPAVVIRVADAFDNFLLTNTSQVTLAITAGSGGGAGGALGGTTSVAAVGGLATFSNLTVDKSGAAYTLTATSGTLTSATSAAFTVASGTATKLGFTTPPASMTAGSTFAPVVAIQDALGNTVASASGSVTLAITSGTGAAGAAIAGTVTLATTNGVATFSGLSIAKAGTGYTLTATSASLTSAVTSAFDVAVGAAAKLVFTAQPANGIAGATLTPAPAAVVQDAVGNAVTTFTSNVTLAITAGTGGASAVITGTSTKAATAGAVTFDNLKINKAGSAYTLTASASGLTSAVSAAFDNAIGAPAKLGVAGQPSNGSGGAALSPTLEIAVQDAAGNTIPGATDAITVALTAGTGAIGASLAGTLTRSALNGVAAFPSLSVDKAASGYTITATATGLTATTSAAFDVAVGQISRLTFVDSPLNGIVGSALLPALRVQGTDAGGNVVTTSSNTVTVGITSGTGTGGATLSGATSLPLRNGEATFNNLAVSATGTGYSLTASGAGLTSGVSSSFDIGAAGNVLAFDEQPSEEGSGIAIVPSIKVSVRTPAGAVVTSATDAITLVITSGSGVAGASIGGTVTRNAVAGIATFDNVTVDLIGTAYTLTATASALVSKTSNAFNIISPPQLRLSTAPPASMANRVTFTTQPVVRLSNAAGEFISTAGVVVTAALTSGGGALTGTATATTDATGTATFTNLALQGTIGAKTITFTTPGYASVTHNINLTVGAAAVMTAHAGTGQDALLLSPVAIPPAVKVTDADGNAVSGVSVTFAVVGGLGGSVTGANTTTDASGIATVGSWTMSANTGPHSLTASATGLTGVNFSANAIIQLLTDEEQVTGMSGAAGSARYFRIVVPAGAIGLDVTMSSGSGSTGDADLYVLQGMQPTTSLYSCRPFLTGNDEMCSIANPANATWHIMVRGASAFTNVSLKASYVMAGDPTNLTIDRVHLNQGSQAYTGTVPLVAGRGALIRVFGKASGTNTATPSVRVRIYKNAVMTREEIITAPGANVTTVISDGDLTKSWNVEVPGSVIEPGISILAEIDYAGTVTETSDSDNQYPVSGTPLALTVQTVPTLNVTFVPVRQVPNDRVGDVTTGNVSDYIELSQRIFPVSTISTTVRATYDFSGELGTSTIDGEWTRLTSEIGAIGAVEGPTAYYYGVFKPASTAGFGGYGIYGQKRAIGVDDAAAFGATGASRRAVTLAHELGHNFNRRHVNCGTPAEPDLSYPYATTTIGTHGYDLVNNTIKNATTYKDIMGYCDPNWISDYTYKAVLTWLTTGTAIVGSPVAAAPAPTRSLLVWGRLSRGQLILEPAFEVDAVPTMPKRSGSYRIEATDAAGNRVFGFSFDMESVDHLAGEGVFAFTVPLPQGQSAHAITLRGNGRLARVAAPGAMASRPVAPVARRTAVAGRTRVTWDPNRYRGALIIDPATNQIIAIGRGDASEFRSPSSSVDVILSDGVSSVRHRAVRPQ